MEDSEKIIINIDKYIEVFSECRHFNEFSSNVVNDLIDIKSKINNNLLEILNDYQLRFIFLKKLNEKKYLNHLLSTKEVLNILKLCMN